MKVINLIIMITLLLAGKTLHAQYENTWITNNVFNSRELYVKKGMVTTLQFSSLIDYFVVGAQEIADVENINNYTLAISPKMAEQTTNLNVTTKDGNYVFVLRVLDYTSAEVPNLHVNIGKLAQQNLTKLQKKVLEQEEKENHNPAFDYDFDMSAPLFCNWWFCDYKKLAPSRVWTDGINTYLDYSTSDGTDREVPNIQQVVDDIDTKVQMDIKNNVIVVKTLAKKLTLSSNGAYVCIEYKGDKYEIQ